jgi:hypothetical protein
MDEGNEQEMSAYAQDLSDCIFTFRISIFKY